MMADNEDLQAGAEFYLCLARAFLPPDSEEKWADLRDALADDLDELAAIRGYDVSAPLAAFRKAVEAIPDHLSVLQIYSGLFLAPPRKASLNTGLYLDGALNGGSVIAMENAYATARLARSEDFRDLSDHIAIQMEFVAYAILARHGATPDDPMAGARAFLGKFATAWLPPFLRELQLADENPNPYLHLAGVLDAAVAVDARSEKAAPKPINKARHDRAVKGIGEDDMAFIARRLSEKGLSVDHLAVPLGQRDEAMGLSKKVTPSPRRGSRLG